MTSSLLDFVAQMIAHGLHVIAEAPIERSIPPTHRVGVWPPKSRCSTVWRLASRNGRNASMLSSMPSRAQLRGRLLELVRGRPPAPYAARLGHGSVVNTEVVRTPVLAWRMRRERYVLLFKSSRALAALRWTTPSSSSNAIRLRSSPESPKGASRFAPALRTSRFRC